MSTSIFELNDFYRRRIELAIKLEILREIELGISEKSLEDNEALADLMEPLFMDESGKLCIRKKGDGFRFFRRTPTRKGIDDEYLSMTDPVVPRLAAKAMVAKLRDDVDSEVRFLNQMLNIRNAHGLGRTMSKQALDVQRIGLTMAGFEGDFLQIILGFDDPVRLERMRNTMDYCRAHSEKNPKFRDRCTKETKAGYWVRSKSEKEIADELYDENIPFLYEPHMVFDGADFYPDFVLIRLDGSLVIWEHRGLDTPSYIEDGYNRLRIYNANGYYMNNNLIYTYEHDVERRSQILKIIMRFYYVW